MASGVAACAGRAHEPIWTRKITVWTSRLACCLLRDVEGKPVPSCRSYPIPCRCKTAAELAAAHLHLGRKRLVHSGQCEPVARSTRGAAHGLGDSFELNNPRGSGEGHGRTFSPLDSEEELPQTWFHGGRSKAWFQRHSPLLIGSRGFHASQGEKRAPRPRYWWGRGYLILR